MFTRPIVLMMVLLTSVAVFGCTDAGVEPGITTLPPPASVVEAQRLIVGRWQLLELWVNGAKYNPPMLIEMAFSSDGFARSYIDGQITNEERYSIVAQGQEYILELKSTGRKSQFCIAGNYFCWNSMIWDGDARLFVRTSHGEY